MSSISDALGDVSEWADQISSWSCKQLEASTLPAHGSTMQKIASYAFQTFQFCIFLPATIALSTASFLVTGSVRLIVSPKMDPMTAFSNNPQWGEPLQTIPFQKDGQPIEIGFATADIQDSGPNQPRFMETNWGRFYEKNKDTIGDLKILPDVLNHPQDLIDECHNMGLTQFRTSISLMPKAGNKIDQISLATYCSFFQKLKNAGIEPVVTLNHFVNPEDFDWTQTKSIERFLNYAKSIADDLYKSGVRRILTFNEPTVYAFQGWIRGVFPPHKTMDLEGAALVMQNMMSAHTKAYEALKKMHSDFEIGLTHDPIRFRNYHDWNPLWAPSEKVLCHYLTEICHGSFMRFLQTGKFSLQVPFLVNHNFEIPAFANAKTRPLDCIGLQYYSDPLLQFPWGSVTDQPGEKVSTYQYRAYPQGLDSAIQEMSTLKVPIHLTEIGIDTGINHDLSDKERIAYFDKIFQVVQKAIDKGANIKSLFWWTKDRSWEWAEGMKVDFSWFDPQPRPVAEWLKEKLANTHAKRQQPNSIYKVS